MSTEVLNKEREPSRGRDRATPQAENTVFSPWLYVLGITAGELIVGLVNVRAGVVVHIILILAMLAQASLAWRQEEQSQPYGFNFYMALVLAPLIRVVSLSLPLAKFPVVYWYLVASLPLFAATYVVARQAGYHVKDFFISGGGFQAQLPVILLGLLLGLVEYCILRPQPLAGALTFKQALVPALILMFCTGWMEELIFRGVLLKAAVEYLGKNAALWYMSILFAVLHITHLSAVDVFFVFSVALLFTLVVYRTGSIWGVALAHGITNITMYLFWPFILS